MQYWLNKAVVVELEGAGLVTGTLLSYDARTFTLQETGGVKTYPLSRMLSMSAGN